MYEHYSDCERLDSLKWPIYQLRTVAGISPTATVCSNISIERNWLIFLLSRSLFWIHIFCWWSQHQYNNLEACFSSVWQVCLDREYIPRLIINSDHRLRILLWMLPSPSYLKISSSQILKSPYSICMNIIATMNDSNHLSSRSSSKTVSSISPTATVSSTSPFAFKFNATIWFSFPFLIVSNFTDFLLLEGAAHGGFLLLKGICLTKKNNSLMLFLTYTTMLLHSIQSIIHLLPLRPKYKERFR